MSYKYIYSVKMWSYEDQVHPELIGTLLDDASWTWEHMMQVHFMNPN